MKRERKLTFVMQIIGDRFLASSETNRILMTNCRFVWTSIRIINVSKSVQSKTNKREELEIPKKPLISSSLSRNDVADVHSTATLDRQFRFHVSFVGLHSFLTRQTHDSFHFNRPFFCWPLKIDLIRRWIRYFERARAQPTMAQRKEEKSKFSCPLHSTFPLESERNLKKKNNHFRNFYSQNHRRVTWTHQLKFVCRRCVRFVIRIFWYSSIAFCSVNNWLSNQ